MGLQVIKKTMLVNLEGHQNRITGSRVTAILLNGWILPIGGASAVEGVLSTGPTPSSSLGIGKNEIIDSFSLNLNLLSLSP